MRNGFGYKTHALFNLLNGGNKFKALRSCCTTCYYQETLTTLGLVRMNSNTCRFLERKLWLFSKWAVFRVSQNPTLYILGAVEEPLDKLDTALPRDNILLHHHLSNISISPGKKSIWYLKSVYIWLERLVSSIKVMYCSPAQLWMQSWILGHLRRLSWNKSSVTFPPQQSTLSMLRVFKAHLTHWKSWLSFLQERALEVQKFNRRWASL